MNRGTGMLPQLSHVEGGGAANGATDMQGYAAIFIDYENVYYHLKTEYADIPELGDFVVDMLMNLQSRLEQRYHVRSIITKAYADYERLRSTPQGSLYLMGVETVNVLGTNHKNAADMKLCIDAMEVMYTRPEIQSFVIFAGDRDYIPIIQHLKKQAKIVISVGFEGSFSGDLMLNVGRKNFIDAYDLFEEGRLNKLEEMAKRYHDYQEAERERDAQRARELEEKKQAIVPEKSAAAEVLTFETVAVFDTPFTHHVEEVDKSPRKSDKKIGKAIDVGEKDEVFHPAILELEANELLTLEFILTNYGRHHEIYLSPMLRKYSDLLPNLADWERKSILANLEYKGVLRMDKRSAQPYDYTVIVLNYNHPAVRALC